MERKIQHIVADLSDLELASLVCLIANEHCIIRAAAEDLDYVQNELELLMENTFGLRHAIVTCSPDTKLEDFRTQAVRESFHGVCSLLQNIEHLDEPRCLPGHVSKQWRQTRW